jgi:hypothetical protein
VHVGASAGSLYVTLRYPSIWMSASVPAVDAWFARLSATIPELSPATMAMIAMTMTVIAISSSIRPKPPSLVASRRKAPTYPPETLKVGLAIWIRSGADQVILVLPAMCGLTPRTRYHHVPGDRGSIADVEKVCRLPAVRHG